MDSDQLMAAEKKYLAQNYAPLPVVLTRGEGCWVWDMAGRKYLDMMSSYSAVSHGHVHPKIYQALTDQASKLCMTSRAFYNDQLEPLAEKLCDLSGLDKMLPMNTGAEAVETALKAARRWGYQKKGIPENQAEIIACENNFHGRTISVISFSTDLEYKKDFGPFTPGFKVIPYGSAAALQAAITPNTCAFLVEPIQGEAGIQIPAQGFLAEARKICRDNNVLFIVDEIQSGLGRTGKWFAYQHENIDVDGLILGKALGGGMLPVSALLGIEDMMSGFNPGSHGSTFGGNPLACHVALAAIRVLEEDGLIENSARLGVYLKKALETLTSPAIKAVRGRGLWVGLEIDPAYASAHDICLKWMKAGVLTKEAHETVVRLAPPLTITQSELDFALSTLQTVV
jgi:ornithine--oxo-acid transaminase